MYRKLSLITPVIDLMCVVRRFLYDLHIGQKKLTIFSFLILEKGKLLTIWMMWGPRGIDPSKRKEIFLIEVAQKIYFTYIC